MQLPKKNRKLREIYMNASVPPVTEFDGEYLVDMLTVWPSFKRFSHRKIFYRKDNGVYGHNVLFNRRWGYFSVEENTLDDNSHAMANVINYNRKENPFLIRGIRDHVRRVLKDSLYIGRFNYMCCGRPRFLGYFSLEKIK